MKSVTVVVEIVEVRAEVVGGVVGGGGKAGEMEVGKGGNGDTKRFVLEVRGGEGVKRGPERRRKENGV